MTPNIGKSIPASSRGICWRWKRKTCQHQHPGPKGEPGNIHVRFLFFLFFQGYFPREIRMGGGLFKPSKEKRRNNPFSRLETSFSTTVGYHPVIYSYRAQLTLFLALRTRLIFLPTTSFQGHLPQTSTAHEILNSETPRRTYFNGRYVLVDH